MCVKEAAAARLPCILRLATLVPLSAASVLTPLKEDLHLMQHVGICRWCVANQGFPADRIVTGPLAFFIFGVTIVVVAVPEVSQCSCVYCTAVQSRRHQWLCGSPARYLPKAGVPDITAMWVCR